MLLCVVFDVCVGGVLFSSVCLSSPSRCCLSDVVLKQTVVVLLSDVCSFETDYSGVTLM